MQKEQLAAHLLALEQKRYVLVENFIPNHSCRIITDFFLRRSDELRESFIGRSHEKSLVSTIRKSELKWITDTDLANNTELANVLAVQEYLMKELNLFFRIKMKRLEAQFSFYPPGGFYKKHIDQHQETRHRIFTAVLYLNNVEDGGELVLYCPGDRQKQIELIQPKAGKLVLFFSGEVFHEVKKVKTARYSINSWMRDDELVPLL